MDKEKKKKKKAQQPKKLTKAYTLELKVSKES